MSDQDRFAELWTDYLEGELSDEGVETLRALLAADLSLVDRAVDLLQTHRLIGLIAAETEPRQDQFVRETLARLPHSQDAFVNQVMAKVAPSDAVTLRSESQSAKGPSTESNRVWIVAAVVLIAVTLYAIGPLATSPIVSQLAIPPNESVVVDHVQLASSSHAKFFGELAPPVGSMLLAERDYVLMSGLVEVSFPKGAAAILEGPAVFRVLSQDSLALDVGRCSVHAPEGAEGFQIVTPATRVVDRGTRFSVAVGEASDTEVQVIEGAADIYGQALHPSDRPTEIRLTDGEARRFASAGGSEVEAMSFDATLYRRQLPDRVISYEATKAADGGAEHLTHVTVQRGGKIERIAVDELIAARLVWFDASEPRAFLCGNAPLPALKIELASDHSLVTGVINPDGSLNPLTTDPVLAGESGTPGMAFRFDRPVVNGPGADVVFFDLQTFGNPPEGDAFHVSPLKFRAGLRSHTIRTYDLTMESPEAQVLTNFRVHFYAERVRSPEQLDTLELSSQKQNNKFRGLAVGIDLADLGYEQGETVQGLFIQDALDDECRVDPVFIGGLPEVN